MSRANWVGQRQESNQHRRCAEVIHALSARESQSGRWSVHGSSECLKANCSKAILLSAQKISSTHGRMFAATRRISTARFERMRRHREMARFYANENFPLPAVESLRMLGHEVITTADAGRAGLAIPDQEVLDYAIQHGLSVLTINRRDFVRLHNASQRHSGIVVCSLDKDFPSLARRIDDAVKQLPSLGGQLIRVNRPAC